MMLNQLLTKLQEKFEVSSVYGTEPSLRFLTISREHALALISHLRDEQGFVHMVLLTAVDRIEINQFQLTYLLHNPESKMDIGIRVPINREEATMDSAHDLWPTISTYQRELREMFGIRFPGSPGIDDDFILEGWQGPPPYRRDFDTLKFSQSFYPQREGRSTHDPASYMKEKLYPNE